MSKETYEIRKNKDTFCALGTPDKSFDGIKDWSKGAMHLLTDKIIERVFQSMPWWMKRWLNKDEALTYITLRENKVYVYRRSKPVYYTTSLFNDFNGKHIWEKHKYE